MRMIKLLLGKPGTNSKKTAEEYIECDNCGHTFSKEVHESCPSCGSYQGEEIDESMEILQRLVL